MNICVLSGRFTDNPQTKKTSTGETMAAFTIAYNEGYGEKKRTEYYDVTAFGKIAERVGIFGKKGNRVQVSGKMEYTTYTKNDEKRKAFRIIANRIEYIDRPEEPKKESKPYEDIYVSDEELPF